MAKPILVDARLIAITTQAGSITSALNDGARSWTLDRLERILPQVKDLLESFDGVAIYFRDQERCRRLKMEGSMEVCKMEQKISFLKRSWATGYFGWILNRKSADEGSLSNEEVSDENIAGTIEGIKDLS